MGSLSSSFSKSTKQQHVSDRYENAKVEIRDKLRSIGANLDEMASLLDHKLSFVCQEINRLEKQKSTKPRETVEAIAKAE